MVEVTIGVLTFLRDEMLYRCIKNLQRNVIPYMKVYPHIVDQGKSTAQKMKFYDELRNGRWRITKFPFDYGVGKCLKFMWDECKTRYFLWLHDDAFPRRESVQTLLKLMKDLSSRNVVNTAPVLWEPRRSCFRYLTGNISIENHKLKERNFGGDRKNFEHIEFNRSGEGIRYILSSYPTNISLFDMKIRRKVNWDSNMRAGSWMHPDLYLQLARTGWTTATTPDAIFDHFPTIAKGGRARFPKDREYISHKWGVKRRQNKRYFMEKWKLVKI